MYKLFAILAAIALVALAANQEGQPDLNVITSTETTTTVDLPADVQAFVGTQVNTEINDDDGSLEPTAEQHSAIEANVTKDDQAKFADQIAATKELVQLNVIKEAIKANLTLIRAAWNATKEALRTTATAKFAEWKVKVQALIDAQNNATDGNQTIEVRLHAVIAALELKAAKKLIAIAVQKLKDLADKAELSYKLLQGALYLVNNTIAQNNAGKVDGITWTVKSYEEIMTRLVAVAVALAIHNFRAEMTDEVTVHFQEDLATLKAQIQARIDNITKHIYQNVQDIRAEWKAHAEERREEIREGVRDFLEAHDVNVTLNGTESTDAKANVSLIIKFAREKEANKTKEQIIADLKRRIHIYIQSHLGVKDGEVTADVQEETTVGTKRGISADGIYTANTQVGNSTSTPATSSTSQSTGNPNDRTGSSASAVALSVVALLVAIAAFL